MTRAYVLLLVLASATLAGCASGPSNDPSPQGQDPVIIKDPSDYSYMENESLDDRSHLHDYWGEAESVLVMDKTQVAEKLKLSPSTVLVTMRPDEGATIMLGTARVEVDVEWQDHLPGVYGRTELWVKTAQMDTAEPVAEVRSGDTVIIESTNADNDLPHQSLSGWEFSLVAYPSSMDPGLALIWAATEVRMTAVAHRGLDIPLFEAHPDHWDGADRLALNESTIDVQFYRGTAGEATFCLAPCPTVVTPKDGHIVPPETEVVEFVVRYDADTTQRLAWDFHGADTWEWSPLTPTTEDGSTYTYRVAIEGAMPDGPYANQSLWEFRPRTPGGFDGVDPAAPSDGLFFGAYTVTLAALRGTEVP